MFGLFNRKKEKNISKINNNGKGIPEELSFKNTLEFVKLFTSDKKDLEDKISIIDFVMNLVKKDLKYDALTTILYQEEHFERDLSTPFPWEVLDAQRNEIT